MLITENSNSTKRLNNILGENKNKMANLNELKKELSKLSGVDFFNPKYRNVFKKYMTTETEEVEKDTNEEERLRNILGEEKETEVREEKTTTEEKVEDNEEKEEVKTKEEIVDDSKEEDKEEVESKETEEVEEDDTDTEDLEDEEIEDDFDEFEDTEEDDSNEEDATDEESMEEDTTDEVVDEEVETKEEYHEEEPAYNKELIDTKVELGLVKAGVRDDRLEDARKLFMADFKGMEDLEHLGEFIKKYPEWIKNGVHNSKAFGMPTNDMGDGYTEEEKKLRSMGINPR
jgi:hypothetical protein